MRDEAIAAARLGRAFPAYKALEKFDARVGARLTVIREETGREPTAAEEKKVKSAALLWALDPRPFTRTGTGGIAQAETNGLTAAAFEHWDSRAGGSRRANLDTRQGKKPPRSLAIPAGPVASPVPEVPSTAVYEDLAERVVASVSAARSTWTVWNLRAEAERQIRIVLPPLPPGRHREIAGTVTALAASPARSICVEAPSLLDEPSELDGFEAMTGTVLDAGQRGLVTMFACDSRVLRDGGRRLVPLATSAASADVLGRELGVRAENVHKFVYEWTAGPFAARLRSGAGVPEQARMFRLHPGDVVLVDEAGMAGTFLLDRLVQLAAARGDWIVTLPAWYVRDHVQLLYAVNAHRVQGTTVDTAHPLITAGMTREALYVLASRAREKTTLYVATHDLPFDDDARVDKVRRDPRQYAGREILLNVLATEGAPLPATETIAAGQEEAASLATLVPRYLHAARQDADDRYRLAAVQALGDDGGRALVLDPAWGAVTRRPGRTAGRLRW